MTEEGLVSSYTKAQYKVHKTQVNETEVGNELDREFNDRDRLEVIVSGLTYVRALSLALYLHHHGLV